IPQIQQNQQIRENHGRIHTHYGNHKTLTSGAMGCSVAVLTFVYVVATIIIAVLSIKTTGLAQKNLDTALELEKNRLRPYVIFNLSSSIRKKSTYASIKNYGLTAAYNIKVSIANRRLHTTTMDDHL